ncbi:MAG: 50S ribosomal protein L15 [Synergistaceae bacterium]|jgi:large subunit ribosomal protein L15|nr:50S ribosomal protein L15 [Synergistaceae bacterium]
MNLHDLGVVPGSKRAAKRLGQGIGSGTGKTSGKGHKGHKSRTGGGVRPGFEGGQMPLARRVPKRGFNNARFAKEYQVVNVEFLSSRFEGGEISVKELYEARLVRSLAQPVKLLAKGEVDKAFVVKVNAVSQSARQKIEAAGGKVEVI